MMPRIVSAGNFISVTGGHGDADALAPDQALQRRPNLADTVDEFAHLFGLTGGRFCGEAGGDDNELVAAHAGNVVVLAAGFF